MAQHSLEKAAELAGQQQAAQLKREVERKRAALERQISGLRADYETEAVELRRIAEQVSIQTRLLTTQRAELGRLRQANVAVEANARGKFKPKPDNGGSFKVVSAPGAGTEIEVRIPLQPKGANRRRQ